MIFRTKHKCGSQKIKHILSMAMYTLHFFKRIFLRGRGVGVGVGGRTLAKGREVYIALGDRKRTGR